MMSAKDAANSNYPAFRFLRFRNGSNLDGSFGWKADTGANSRIAAQLRANRTSIAIPRNAGTTNAINGEKPSSCDRDDK